jgi:hypothetical protein
LSPIAETLKTQLLQLPQKERAELAYFLLQSLHEEEEDGWDAAWEQELLRRSEEVRSGEVDLELASSVYERLRARLK